MAEGQSCAMPLNPGSYAPGNDALEVTIPDIPAILEPFLKGDISVKAQGFDPSGAEVACLALTIELS